MPSIGIDIQTLAKILAKEREPESHDPSVEIIVHLALAYASLEKLRDEEADLEIGGRPLIAPSLERAYREILYVRSRQPGELLDTSIITRYGRYVGEGKV